MFLNEYLTKRWVSAQKMVTQIAHPLNPKVLELICIFPNLFLLLGALNVRFLSKDENTVVKYKLS